MTVEGGVTLMVLAVVVIGVALEDLSVVETVAGLINVMKMIGPSHLHQVNVWNSKYQHFHHKPF